METTSLTLLQCLRQPNGGEAWDRFLRLYSTGIYAWVRKRGFQHNDAADIVQDIFITLLQKLPQFSHEGARSFRAWLWTITCNKCRERTRKRQMALAPFDSADEVADLEDEPFWEDEFRHYLISRIASVIEVDYPPEVWRAFWAHAVEGKAASQVAAELGINLWAVYTAKARIVHRLQQEFAELVVD